MAVLHQKLIISCAVLAIHGSACLITGARVAVVIVIILQRLILIKHHITKGIQFKLPFRRSIARYITKLRTVPGRFEKRVIRVAGQSLTLYPPVRPNVVTGRYVFTGMKAVILLGQWELQVILM